MNKKIVNIKNYTKKFITNEDGMTTVEYVLLAVFIVIAVIASVKGLQTVLSSKFNKTGAALNS